MNLNKLDIYHDIRKDVYHEIECLTIDDLAASYHQEIKPVQYNVALIGKKENLDMKAIENLGEFKEVTLEEIFGY